MGCGLFFQRALVYSWTTGSLGWEEQRLKTATCSFSTHKNPNNGEMRFPCQLKRSFDLPWVTLPLLKDVCVGSKQNDFFIFLPSEGCEALELVHSEITFINTISPFTQVTTGHPLNCSQQKAAKPGNDRREILYRKVAAINSSHLCGSVQSNHVSKGKGWRNRKGLIPLTECFLGRIFESSSSSTFWCSFNWSSGQS